MKEKKKKISREYDQRGILFSGVSGHIQNISAFSAIAYFPTSEILSRKLHFDIPVLSILFAAHFKVGLVLFLFA